ncbi:MAG TPA: hemerythrin family protein [Planctomycetota bacterium]|nr:hemerythrin family protein [Planctomycetota bacterium]
MTALPVFLWSDAYLVGNEEIDGQHRRMFMLANTLPEKCTEASAQAIIAKLFAHAEEHFAAEERLMRQFGYPGAAAHRQLHTELAIKLQALSARALDSDENIRAFRQFVYDWITDHILNQDREFFLFCRDGSAGGRP